MQRCVALAPAVRWLLHLDMDELFFCQGFRDHHSESPRAVFAEWVAALDTHSCDHLAIVNYEAVPTQRLGGNFFVSTTRFRRHTARVPLHAAAQDALQFWQQRSPFGQYFLFYDNGKPIVRVAQDVAAASVHHWRSSNKSWVSTSNFYDPRLGSAQQGARSRAPWIPKDERLQACILHYPVCGREWLSEKYERLGDFPSVWGASSVRIAPCFPPTGERYDAIGH
ncbi:hypothetical protein PINS_up009684 [Pythium insidiosum]|nr:hypothetical protein PINS_up009684 [Pythium insidiosum]